MKRDKNEMFELAKKLITEKQLIFMCDVFALLPISKDTFYKYFPSGSDELKELQILIDKVRVNEKLSQRNDWRKSDNATLRMGIYKLLATDDELYRLSGQQIDVKGEMSLIHNIKYDFGEEEEDDEDQ